MQVMDAFEETELEKKRKKDVTFAKPEFKQHFLAPIRSLSVEDQVELLTHCLEDRENISLPELKKEAALLKQLGTLKKKFAQLTNSKVWENSVTLYPLHARESELKKFISLDFSKGVPKTFSDFCKRAKGSKDNVNRSQSLSSDIFVQKNETSAYTINEKSCELTSNVISSIFPEFEGANLVVASIKPVSTIISLMYFMLFVFA